MAIKEHLFEDVSLALDSWVSAMTASLLNEEARPAWVEDMGLARVNKKRDFFARCGGILRQGIVP